MKHSENVNVSEIVAGLGALQCLAGALIETHPYPRRLLAAFKPLRETQLELLVDSTITDAQHALVVAALDVMENAIEEAGDRG